MTEDGFHTVDAANQNGLVVKCLLSFLGALLLMAVFQSAALVTTAYDLPPGFGTETAVAMAKGWHGWMEALGAAQFSEAVHDRVESLRYDWPLA